MKTAELTGAALDWAVAKAEGFTFGHWQINNASYVNVWAERLDAHGCGPAGYFPEDECFHYSTDWAQGGPIIEREEIYARPTGDAAKWEAMVWRDTDSIATCGFRHTMYGSTPLIAAMRCFVHSKLSDEVDVPKELLP